MCLSADIASFNSQHQSKSTLPLDRVLFIKHIMPLYKILQVDKEVWLSPVEIDLATQIKHSNVADIVCSLCALRKGLD